MRRTLMLAAALLALLPFVEVRSQETKTIAERLGYVDPSAIEGTRRLSTSVFRLINGLRRYIAGPAREPTASQ